LDTPDEYHANAIGVDEDSSFHYPNICWVGLTLTDEVAAGAGLNILLTVNCCSPLTDDGEVATQGNFNTIHGVVGSWFTDHPTISVNGLDFIIRQKFLGHLLPRIALGPDTDYRTVAQRFSAFKGIHEEFVQNSAVNEKVDERFGPQAFRFGRNSPTG